MVPKPPSPLLLSLQTAVQQHTGKDIVRLARIAGCSTDLLYRLRRGELPDIGVNKAERLALELGIRVAAEGVGPPVAEYTLHLLKRGGAPTFSDRPSVKLPRELQVTAEEMRMILLRRSADHVLWIQKAIEEIEHAAKKFGDREVQCHGLVNGAVTMLQTVVSSQLQKSRRQIPGEKK